MMFIMIDEGLSLKKREKGTNHWLIAVKFFGAFFLSRFIATGKRTERVVWCPVPFTGLKPLTHHCSLYANVQCSVLGLLPFTSVTTSLSKPVPVAALQHHSSVEGSQSFALNLLRRLLKFYAPAPPGIICKVD